MTQKEFNSLTYDFVTDDYYFCLFEKHVVDEILGTLTPREEQVLRLLYGIDDGKQRSLEEVGYYFNVTRERIRQIQKDAFHKLRKKDKLYYNQILSNMLVSWRENEIHARENCSPGWVWSSTMHEYDSIEEALDRSDCLLTGAFRRSTNSTRKANQHPSLLYLMGYDIFVPVQERHEILDSAVKLLGKEKVEEFLTRRINSCNYRYDRYRAYEVWHDDLIFVQKIK